jgi:hypothetical protein
MEPQMEMPPTGRQAALPHCSGGHWRPLLLQPTEEEAAAAAAAARLAKERVEKAKEDWERFKNNLERLEKDKQNWEMEREKRHAWPDPWNCMRCTYRHEEHEAEYIKCKICQAQPAQPEGEPTMSPSEAHDVQTAMKHSLRTKKPKSHNQGGRYKGRPLAANGAGAGRAPRVDNSGFERALL